MCQFTLRFEYERLVERARARATKTSVLSGKYETELGFCVGTNIKFPGIAFFSLVPAREE